MSLDSSYSCHTPERNFAPSDWLKTWHTPRSKRNLSNNDGTRTTLVCGAFLATSPYPPSRKVLNSSTGLMGPTMRLWRPLTKKEWQGFFDRKQNVLEWGLVVFYLTLEREVEACKFKWLGGSAETQHNTLLFWCNPTLYYYLLKASRTWIWAYFPLYVVWSSYSKASIWKTVSFCEMCSFES